MGSSPAARPGPEPARSAATAMKSTATVTYVAGSVGVTPTSRLPDGARHDPGREQAHQKADPAQHQALADHQLKHPARCAPKRHPHANLHRPLPHRGREHAVKPDGGQQMRDTGEDADEREREARLRRWRERRTPPSAAPRPPRARIEPAPGPARPSRERRDRPRSGRSSAGRAVPDVPVGEEDRLSSVPRERGVALVAPDAMIRTHSAWSC